ncbi:MAG: bifunctional methylenetetrahydrofolate dehydrogenase/methenyltetrahydrofolate cyclohydrolase FolD [Deltaproteobacteria bacterium]|nr:bifunctional methylenetetrahydrofolate dehydrogenase/methenyltetrahydrofolate cyclohydrolase FolD [Deltaproteobacteria bacterium]
MAELMDGKALAKEVKRALKQEVAQLIEQGVTPGLAVVLVGEDPASAVYVRSKTRTCKRLGLAHFDHVLPAETGQAQLMALVDELNADTRVHGILVQLPLPNTIDEATVLERIDPRKDVDGFHPENLGRLMIGEPRFVPCTPAGVMRLLDAGNVDYVGKHAVVVGRSRIVGKPVAQLLLARHCTVTMAHSRTRDLDEVVRSADIVVAAVGRAELVKGDWIKPGAAVVDVGINRVGEKLVGDVAFEAAAERAALITPVPGGVGPMTIAMLMENTVSAAKLTLG